jgi:hypothetical protein
MDVRSTKYVRQPQHGARCPNSHAVLRIQPTQVFPAVLSSVNSNGSTIRNHSPESCDSVTFLSNVSSGQIPFASRTTFTISFMISVSS